MQIRRFISTGTYKESAISWYKPRIVGNAFISDINLFKVKDTIIIRVLNVREGNQKVVVGFHILAHQRRFPLIPIIFLFNRKNGKRRMV